MPQYKLTYFNVRARAEVARMLFALADVEYEDYRLKPGEWPELKPKTPGGSLPTLEIEGCDQVFCQSPAIARYLANKFGYAGKTDLDKLRVDMLVDCMDDMYRPFMASIRSANSDEEKAAVRKKWVEEQAPEWLERFEKMLKQNKGGDGWLVGDDITLADLTFQNWLDFPEYQMKVNLDLSKYPKLQAHKKRVESHPKIAAWIAKRPS